MTRHSETGMASGVNQAQREYWTGDGWREYAERGDRWEAIMRPFGEAMQEAAALRPGERVLDVGCGHGTSTVEAAMRVAPGGTVLGVDISPEMLGPARQRIAGTDNVDLLVADAQVHPFPPGSFDAVISRFGTMFFGDPRAAFANLHAALRPGGRLVFVCWQDPRRIEWIAVSLGAVIPLLGRPPDLGEPGVPGAFALADGDRLRGLLTDAGFGTVDLAEVVRPQRIGPDVDDAAGFILALPESRQMFADAPAETPATAAAALRAAFQPFLGPRGVVMDGTAWLVTAHR